MVTLTRGLQVAKRGSGLVAGHTLEQEFVVPDVKELEDLIQEQRQIAEALENQNARHRGAIEGNVPLTVR